MLHIGICSLLLVCCSLAGAVDIVGQIRWNDLCPNATTLGHARALLDEGVYYGSITSNGKFVIPGAPDGTYILSIDSHDYAFDQYRIDIKPGAVSQVEVRPYILGTPMDPPSDVLLPYPLSIAAKETFVYFLPQEGFNLGGMLLNPMMLAMILCGVLVLAMPYIMKNLDPDVLEEFQKKQARLGRTSHQGDTNSSISASSSSVDGNAPLIPRMNKATSTKPKAGGKKSKR